MTETTPARTYVFEPGTIDRERLNLAANRLNEPTLEALGRAGGRPGDHVLDVGCGPGGALLLLAETADWPGGPGRRARRRR
jgi:cyclopropane fatty-acyl-phospholipid synthase-like methyltransferase